MLSYSFWQSIIHRAASIPQPAAVKPCTEKSSTLPVADDRLEQAKSKNRALTNKLAHRNLSLIRLQRQTNFRPARDPRADEELPPLLLFTHIPKSAGSSVIQLFVNNAHPGRYHELYDLDTQYFEIDRETIRQRVLPLNDAADVISSHIPLHYRLWEFIDRPVCNATVLRDPVERVISHYYYLRTIGHVNPVGRRLVEEQISLEDYVRTHRLDGSENLMVRFLARTANPSREKQCSGSMLNEAIENLELFDILGITEKFDEFVDRVCDMFSYQCQDSLHVNANSERLRQEEIPQSTIDTIKEFNALDIELYETAKKAPAVTSQA